MRDKLNIGNNSKLISGWFSLDIKGKENDITHDLNSCKPIPVESGSLTCIYCSFVLEHLFNDAAGVLFSEAYRMLKSGGIFRVVVPDPWAEARSSDIKAGERNQWPPLDIKGGLSERDLLKRIYSAHSRVISDNDLSVLRNADFIGALDKMQLDAQKSDRIEGSDIRSHRNHFDEKRLIKMFNDAGFIESVRTRRHCSLSVDMRDENIFDNSYPHFAMYVDGKKD